MSEKEETIALYGVYVQTISANEQRRQALAAFYLSLVAVGIALLGSEKVTEYMAIAIPMAIVSMVWFSTIRYFRNLAIAKFKVIAELEQEFNIKPFAREWIYYKAQKSKFRVGLTQIELIIPILIFIISTLYILYRICQKLVLYFQC